MKKILLYFLSIIAFSSIDVKAQDYVFDNPDNRSYLGVRLGFDIMSLQSPTPIYENRGGIELGVIYNMPVWKNLFFEPGLSLFYNSATINGSIPYPSGAQKVTAAGTLNDWGFRIPLNFGYHFDITDAIQVIPATGPVVNINLSTDVNYNAREVQQGFDYFNLHHNIIDLGWHFGIGVKIRAIYIGVGGTVGLSRLVTQNNSDYILNGDIIPLHARRNLFNITLGYNF